MTTGKDRTLTPKQQRFVEEYLIDLNVPPPPPALPRSIALSEPSDVFEAWIVADTSLTFSEWVEEQERPFGDPWADCAWTFGIDPAPVRLWVGSSVFR